MPLYEYACPSCPLVFEELVRSSSEKVICPKCGSGEVQRQLSTFASHGSGSSDGASAAPSRSGGGCGGCHGGNCGSCH